MSPLACNLATHSSHARADDAGLFSCIALLIKHLHPHKDNIQTMSFTGSQQFKVVRGLPAICYYAAVRPSDQAICVACYDSTFTYLSIVSSSNGSALAKVSWKTSGKSRFVSDDDRVAAVALDS